LSQALAPRSGVRRLASTYRQFRQVIHEGAKFGIVGLTGLAVTNIAFVPLHEMLHLGPLTSITIAYAVATVVTFLGNRYWSFRDRAGSGTARESAMFFLLNGVGLLIQYAVLGLGDYALGLTSRIDNLVAVNLGIGLGTLFRFWSYRKWVWVAPTGDGGAHSPASASWTDAEADQFWDDVLADTISPDSLRHGQASESSGLRTPQTPAAG
jgi:putative flippase GtrA